MFDLQKNRKIHFIGIGGIGMSGLARILRAQGKIITGSDMEDSELIKDLTQEGFWVTVGHQENNIKEDLELVVYSAAIPDDNVELKTARERGIPTLTYAETLGSLTQNYETICIAGTHGKTTVTALTSLVLEAGGLDPTVLIGTKLKQFENKNVRLGRASGAKGFFVLEACEYKRAFLNYQPKMVVLTNLEPEHLDYYKDFDDYKAAFKDLIKKIPADGYLVYNADDEAVKEVVSSDAQAQKISFGVSGSADFQLKEKSFWRNREKLGDLDLAVPGHHNYLNALAAMTVGMTLELKPEKILAGLKQFTGSWRRFEYKGNYQGAMVYDDYAHHPTEIQATLEAIAEKFPEHQKIIVFQPHQYNRTKKLFNEFVKAFEKADEVIIPNIYAVRDSDEDKESISAEALVEGIKSYHPQVRYGNGLANTLLYLKKHLKDGDVIFTMGAGDVWKVGEGLLVNTKTQ